MFSMSRFKSALLRSKLQVNRKFESVQNTPFRPALKLLILQIIFKPYELSIYVYIHKKRKGTPQINGLKFLLNIDSHFGLRYLN